jgi:hypothetical protein
MNSKLSAPEGNPMRPRTLTIWAALAVLVPMSAASAAPPVRVESLRIGLNWQTSGVESRIGLFKVGTWTPVWVQLSAGPAPFSGFLNVVVPDDDDVRTSLRRPMSIAANTTEWFATYARPGSMSAEFEVQVLDVNGRRTGAEWLSSQSHLTIDDLAANQMLLVTLGNPQGVSGIPGVSGVKDESNRLNGDLVMVVAMSVPDGLPGRWYGYDAADAVVIDTNDRDVMDALAQRGQALKTWVRNGGHLVVSVGANWQQVSDSILADMLPAAIRGRTQLDDLGTLESFAGSTKPVSKVGGQRATVTRLEDWEARGGKALDSTATPLIVRGPYGFGRVTLIALDVDQKPFASWEDRPLFWMKALDLRRPDESGGADGTGPAGPRTLYQSNATDLSTLLRQSLDQFQGVRLVPFGWVAFFIFLYILLIGPGDYLFLKKVVKRMEFTWITFPLIVLSVSLLAYAAAYMVKGTELLVNKIDVVDIDQEPGLLRGSTWFTVFSPQNRDYDVAVVPQPLDRDSTDRLSPAPKRLPEGSDLLLSWFGVPESIFGGMNSSGRLGLSGAGYSYAPFGADQAPDRPEALKHVRVPIWSTRSFTARWSAQAVKAVDADLQVVGTDRLSGTVTNLLDQPMRNTILAFGKQVYHDLGTIEPGASVQVELKSDRTLVGYLSNETQNLPAEPWGVQRATNLNRRALLLASMFHDAAGGRAAMLASKPLHYLDLSGQLALDRPMLVAEIDARGAALELGDAGQLPKVTQTTLLRVILPLGKPQDGQSQSTGEQ